MKFFDENNFKAAIFDLDGTLIDSMHLWRRLLPDFLDKHGLKAPADMLRRVAFMTLTQSSEYVAEEFPQLSMTGREIREEWMGIIYEDYSKRIELKPGAKELIETLKSQGVKLAVATACAKKLAEACLKNNGVRHLFDDVTYAEDIGCGKDTPGVYEECLRRLGCSADEAVLFEDILMAIKTAASIGLKTIAVEDETAASDSEEIKKTAFGYIADFTEIL